MSYRAEQKKTGTLSNWKKDIQVIKMVSTIHIPLTVTFGQGKYYCPLKMYSEELSLM